MGVGKNILLVFVSFLLVLSIIFLGIFWSIHTFLYPQVYEKALADSGAYNSLNLTDVVGGSFIKIPSTGVQGIANTLLENTLSYMRGDSPTLNLTLEVDTQKLKDFFLKSAEEFRVCNPGEEPFNGSEPVCRPRDLNASKYLDQVLEKKNFTIIEGEKVNLADVFGLKKTDTAKMRSYVMSYKYTLYGLLIFVLILLVLIFFITESRTRWSGVDLFLGGIIVFLGGTIVFPMIFSIIPNEIGFIQSISKELLDTLSSRIQTYSFVVMGVGVLGFVLSFFIKKKNVEEKKKIEEVKKK